MSRRLDIFTADPAGNITLFVTTPTARADYQEIAAKLLARKELKGEQVAFIIDGQTMEMCGLEFCGNASRAFGLYAARRRGVTGKASVRVRVSGSAEPVTVQVDARAGSASLAMPNPLSIRELAAADFPLRQNAALVDMGGILHVVLLDAAPSPESFDKIKAFIERRRQAPALGVMFYNRRAAALTPVVYVKDVDTTYFEGSCASGTVATAAVLAQKEADGVFTYVITQPAGVLTATVEKKGGALFSVCVDGPVAFSPVFTVEI